MPNETTETGSPDTRSNEGTQEATHGVVSQRNPALTLLTFHSIVCTPQSSKLFSLLIFINCLGSGLAIISYRSDFLLFKFPLSALGTVYTEYGRINLVPRFIFDVTMMSSGFLMTRIYSDFAQSFYLYHAGPKRVLAAIGAVGFFVLMFPYDVNDRLHEVGATLVFGSLWSLTVRFSLDLKQSFSRTRFLISQIVLQATVLPYVGMFIIHAHPYEAAQKFAVTGLMIALWLTTRRFIF